MDPLPLLRLKMYPCTSKFLYPGYLSYFSIIMVSTISPCARGKNIHLNAHHRQWIFVSANDYESSDQSYIEKLTVTTFLERRLDDNCSIQIQLTI